MGEKDLTILLTNDDGYRAKGINILADYLEEIADVRIVAPKGNRSGVSHSVTLTKDLLVEPKTYKEREVYTLSGMPADCVNYGLELFYPDEIDIVVSGINHGRNLATDLYVSGTVAGARAAAFSPYDMVGIAISAATSKSHPCKLDLAAEFCTAFTSWLYDALQDNSELFKGMYFNLNVPITDHISGVALTYPGIDRGANGWYEEVKQKGKKTHYRRRWRRPSTSTEIGSDTWATQNGYLSITILSLEPCTEREKDLETLLLEEFSFKSYSLERFEQNT